MSKQKDKTKNKAKDKTKDVQEKQYYGGQAVIEGVMMRGKKSYCLAVRGADNEIKTQFKRLAEPKPIMKLPIIRGVAAFVDSLVMGTKLIYTSADMAGLSDLTDENPGRFEKLLQKVFGNKLYDAVMMFSVVLAIFFSVGLFMLLPITLAGALNSQFEFGTSILSILEAVFRLIIFTSYLFLISKVKDVRRTLQYHGAEHKTINCYEQGDTLNPETVQKYSRLHKRCGTSFLLVVIVISTVLFFFVRTESNLLCLLIRLVLVPLIAGISYEFIRFAGRTENKFVWLLSKPGMLMQKLTTKEPDDKQIEIAITALEGVLKDDGKA